MGAVVGGDREMADQWSDTLQGETLRIVKLAGGRGGPKERDKPT